MVEYVGAVDIGGTFTDCTLVDETGEVTTSKVRSTPEDNFQTGFFTAVERAGEKAGEGPVDIFEKLRRLTHGTTVATNAIVENQGADIGVLTTKGHEDTLEMMRGLGRVTNEPPENVLKVAEMRKPDSLVPSSYIKGIPERVDSEGEVVSPLTDADVEAAVEELLADGVDGIAVSYLWSFQNPDHEIRTAELIEEQGDETFVSLSHEISPTLGEHERSTATAINSIVGPLVETYIQDLQSTLEQEYGFDGTFLLMGANGGSYPVEWAVDFPVMLIGSGPVGGLKGSQRLARTQDLPNVIATDMGGTSFELGVLREYRPLVQERTTIQKYYYDIPKLDVKSIGAGGGSIATADGNRISVGPESAGADPGPACYKRGGDAPTVTDANLLLGFIDPQAEFGTDALQPSKELAEEAIEGLADELGQSPLETAAGIFDIVNSKMANLIEQEIIGRGYDPRNFHVISYGGAGPIHASSYARQLDAESIIIPGEISPVWSSYGIVNTDIRRELEQEVIYLEPFDAEQLESKYRDLEDTGTAELEDEGIDSGRLRFERYALMRFEGQAHELEIPVPATGIDESVIEDLTTDFKEEYAERYSTAALFPKARIEIRGIRVEPTVPVEVFERTKEQAAETASTPSPKGTRDIYWPSEQRTVETEVYDGLELPVGSTISGPTVVDMPNTSIVVRAGQQLEKDQYRDMKISTTE